MQYSEEPQGGDLRLHPLSILFSLGGELRNLAIPALLAFFAIRRSDSPIMVQLAIVLVLGLFAALWRYLSFRLRYGETELVIRSGVIRRNERHIPYNRIQSIDSRRNAFHQLFGVAEVIIQTAGGDEPEAKLSVLPADAVDEIRVRVFRRRSAAMASRTAGEGAPGSAEPQAANYPEAGGTLTLSSAAELPADVEEKPRETLLRLRTPQLLRYGFIENRGMFIVLAATGLAFEFGPLQGMLENALNAEFEERGPFRAFLANVAEGSAIPLPMIVFGAAAVLALLIIVRLLSVLWAAVRMHDFTVTRIGDDLRVEYGLLTRVAGTIPMRRIQSVTVRETLAHRLFGCATVDVSTAGGGRKEEGRDVHEPLVPVIPLAQVPQFLHTLWRDLDLAPAEWRPLHPRAHVRIFRASLIGATVYSLLLFLVLRWWVVPVFLLMCAWSYLSARKKAAHRRWTIHAGVFAVRGGWLRRSTIISWLNKIQVVQLRESLFDRRHGMADISADTGGDTSSVSYLPREGAREVLNELTEAAARTRFRW
jgi:putative membrane protein